MNKINHPQKLSTARIAFILAVTVILGGTFLLQVQYLLWGDWGYDQGYYLLVARLMNDGYQPYSEIFMSEPPLMAWSVGFSLTVFESVEGMQLAMIGYGILAVAALVSIGISVNNKLTGLLAGAVFAFNFSFFFSARRVMPESPSMSLALVSLALALRYHTSSRRFYIAASGVMMGGSLLIKYFMPWMIPLIVLILTIPATRTTSTNLWSLLWADRRRIIGDWLLWGGSFLSTILFLSWLSSDLPTLFDQTILFHLFKTAGTESTLMGNIDQIGLKLGADPILLLSALLGLGIAIANFKQRGWIAVIWLGLALIFVLLYSPLRGKHLLLLIPIMSLLSASAITFLLTSWPSRTHKNRTLNWGSVAGGVLLVMLLTIDLFSPYQALADPKEDMIEEGMQPLAALIDKFTAPNDCVITDNPFVSFVTKRIPPPWLANLSYARFTSGYIDTQTLLDITNSYNCQLVAPILDRLKNSNRTYYDWAKGHYLRVWVLDGKEIMVGKPLQEADPNLPLNVNFADQVDLLGADWYPGHPDQNNGHLSLYWLTKKPFEQNYKIFVQLRDSANQTIANADHEAYDGLIPTQRWPVDAILKDTIRLDWPADLPPGLYSIHVGFYDPNTFERLPIINDVSGENAVVASEIMIQ